jgi:hypothetical protein
MQRDLFAKKKAKKHWKPRPVVKDKTFPVKDYRARIAAALDLDVASAAFAAGYREALEAAVNVALQMQADMEVDGPSREAATASAIAAAINTLPVPGATDA